MMTRRNLLAASLTGPSLCAASPLFAGQRLSQAALAEIAHCHSRWLAGEPDGAYADLRGADLAELCLDGIDLSYADLSGARLKGSYGHGFICLRGRLTGADLTGARLIAPIPTDLKRHRQGLHRVSTKKPPSISAVSRFTLSLSSVDYADLILRPDSFGLPWLYHQAQICRRMSCPSYRTL